MNHIMSPEGKEGVSNSHVKGRQPVLHSPNPPYPPSKRIKNENPVSRRGFDAVIRQMAAFRTEGNIRMKNKEEPRPRTRSVLLVHKRSGTRL